MMKFLPEHTNFFIQEVPDEISLGLYITNCGLNCKGCNMSYLQEDKGIELTKDYLCEYFNKYDNNFSNVLFYGGDNFESDLIPLLNFCREKGYKTTLYTGRNEVSNNILNKLDYLKLGEYNEELGDLTKKTTNQKFFNLHNNKEITYKFWRKNNNEL